MTEFYQKDLEAGKIYFLHKGPDNGRSVVRVSEACCQLSCIFMVPTRTGKPGKMGQHFPVREKSGNFAETGKVREFYHNYSGKSEKNDTGKLKKKYWKIVS